ncbi:MAG TPA: hypothetical protein VKE40_08795, partial [Gemmataceae bacterium]|nr:hypothetical protein [Gemmataceae bacterium]
MNRLLFGMILVSTAPALAQTPAARLGTPVPPSTITVRSSSPDTFPDSPPLPAARLGTITTARIGEGPDDAPPDERYNWGA